MEDRKVTRPVYIHKYVPVELEDGVTYDKHGFETNLTQLVSEYCKRNDTKVIELGSEGSSFGNIKRAHFDNGTVRYYLSYDTITHRQWLIDHGYTKYDREDGTWKKPEEV